MRGVKFDDLHTYRDWGLFLKSAPKISSPEPKTYYVDIPGAHGALDLTTALTGEVKFKNRKITMEFVRIADRQKWYTIYNEMLASVHGQKKKIILDDDPYCSYTGRVTLGDPKIEGKIVNLQITAEVEPYRKTDVGGNTGVSAICGRVLVGEIICGEGKGG